MASKNFSFQEKELDIPPVILAEPEKIIPQITPEKKIENKKVANAKLEEKIGTKLFSRLGIIALVIGVGFFIKYVNDNNLISYAVRIWLGVAAGVLLVAGGEYASRFKKYANWGKVLVGGGLATIYFVAYAAYAFVDYREALGMTQAMDIVLLVLIALLAVIFSLRDNSQIIAAEAFSLGFLTCLLNNDFGNMVLVYDFILTIALVATAAYKKWPLIGIGGVVGSYLVYILWRDANPHADSFALSFLSLFFLSYALQSTLFSYKLAGKKAIEAKVALANTLNSFLFFIFGLLIVNEWKGDWNALFCLIFSVFHLLGSWATWFFGKKISSYVYFYFGIASLAIAVPLWLDKEMITIVWSALSLIVLLAGLKSRYRPLEYAAYVLSFLTVWKVILFDTSLHGFSLDDIFASTRVMAYLAAAVFFLIAYFVLIAKRNNISETFKDVTPYAYAFIPTFLLAIMFGLEVGDGNSNWFTFWWGLLFLGVALMPLIKNCKEFNWQGTLLGSLVFFKVLIVDLLLASMEGTELTDYHLPIYLTVIACILGASVFWRFNKKLLAEKEKHMPIVYQWLGIGLSFLVIAIELDGYWVSVGWAALALALIFAGFLGKDKHSRYQGIVILGFTLLKVFLYDTSELETIYRTISYMFLGGILLGASFLYSKYKDKILG